MEIEYVNQMEKSTPRAHQHAHTKPGEAEVSDAHVNFLAMTALLLVSVSGHGCSFM
jgi:hypothetical protein